MPDINFRVVQEVNEGANLQVSYTASNLARLRLMYVSPGEANPLILVDIADVVPGGPGAAIPGQVISKQGLLFFDAETVLLGNTGGGVIATTASLQATLTVTAAGAPNFTRTYTWPILVAPDAPLATSRIAAKFTLNTA